MRKHIGRDNRMVMVRTSSRRCSSPNFIEDSSCRGRDVLRQGSTGPHPRRGPVSFSTRPYQIEAHEILRGKGLEVRLSLALSTIQVTIRISSAKLPEGTIDGDTTDLHLHNLGMELKGRKILSSSCTRDSAHKTSGLTDLTSTYSVCTRRVFGGFEPRPSGLESDALTTRLPTARKYSKIDTLFIQDIHYRIAFIKCLMTETKNLSAQMFRQ
ncbi:hypothetical protein TNCV_3502081 [Trichonephila clavipes]|uniref:Uncharacterized protein n=1 Tax=Trichonephila clavipes TaxID=2585209 RepID=A0A8X6RY57_TRICX|nr:hypothetical protein TNCV_3502081 [Trichonephila clavipes]